MKLYKILAQKRSDILKGWLDSILDAYPADTRRFLKKRGDRFENPVGYTLKKGTEDLLGELLREGDMDPGRANQVLDGIIRVFAVQDFSPSRAVLFIFNLKKVIRRALGEEAGEGDFFEDLLKFEEKIDDAALIAFDIYMKCREKIYEISANHAKNQVSGLLRKSGLICEIPEWDPNKPERRLA
jgi:hypothetical protein